MAESRSVHIVVREHSRILRIQCFPRCSRSVGCVSSEFHDAFCDRKGASDSIDRSWILREVSMNSC